MPGRIISRKVDLPLEPHELFVRAAAAVPDGSGVSFLDSSLVHERFGTRSVLAWRPARVLSSKGRSGEVRSGGDLQRRQGSPFELLREELAARRSDPPPAEAPWGFTGAVGYLGYDLCHSVERLPRTVPDEEGLPDLYFAFYDSALVYDHVTGTWTAAARDRPGGRPAGELIESMLDEAASFPAAAADVPAGYEILTGEAPLESNFRRAEYEAAVARAIEYIAAGDIFQVNLSQRFTAGWPRASGAVGLYSALRRVNAAPFAAYLGLGGGRSVLSSSPERFLLVEGPRVETRPIKGTRPRGATEIEDERLRAELLASEKDLAEITMIVDLERNDLGRVCDYGSVRVLERATLESYARVHHLVATVVGELHDRYDLVDLLKATFPGGSITGAPKVRAMEIIDELERCQRSVYCGAVGYISDSGAMDLNIAIRTMLYSGGASGDGRVTFQVGGGIVADSDPAAEYQETLDKARALIEALRTGRRAQPAAAPSVAGGAEEAAT